MVVNRCSNCNNLVLGPVHIQHHVFHTDIHVCNCLFCGHRLCVRYVCTHYIKGVAEETYGTDGSRIVHSREKRGSAKETSKKPSDSVHSMHLHVDSCGSHVWTCSRAYAYTHVAVSLQERGSLAFRPNWARADSRRLCCPTQWDSSCRYVLNCICPCFRRCSLSYCGVCTRI